jgi:osmotically-inducible protein OsmY
MKRPHPPVLASLAAATVTGGAACAAGTSQSAEYIDTAAVTPRAKTALIREPGIKADAINVEGSRGRMFPSGGVDSRGVAGNAVSAPPKLGGVRAVKDASRATPAA